jgi:uncharacterized protein YbjT (DUF2867 family)
MILRTLFLALITLHGVLPIATRSLPQRKVLVTGAAGRTGQLVFSSLMKSAQYYPLGLVRTEAKAKKLMKEVDGCGLEHVWVCDVTTLDPSSDEFPNGLADTEAMIICTSAVPKLRKRSLLKAFLKIPLKVARGEKAIDFKDFQFYYKDGQHPEKVDYEGQKAQIDLAKQLDVKHVVLVSSMGGTDPNDFLNSFGKDKNGEGDGDILVWKRKAEKYLVDSGLHYTIIHPGGLKDTNGGEMNLDLDVDDILKSRKVRTISRCDVARLCIAALSVSNGRNSSFDCVNKEVPEGSQRKCAEESLKDFLASEKEYDYSDMDHVPDFSI